MIATYVHNAVTEGLGKIGVLVALETDGDATTLGPLGRQIAMHVAATNPLALDASGIDPATVERETAILREKNAGKPDHVLQKIVESGLKSYYKEVTLLEQPFVHDPSKSVAQVLKEAEAKAGKPVALKSFVRFALGEGIEKDEGRTSPPRSRPRRGARSEAWFREGLRLSGNGAASTRRLERMIPFKAEGHAHKSSTAAASRRFPAGCRGATPWTGP